MQNRPPMRLYLPHITHGAVGSVSGSAHFEQNGVRTLFGVLHFGHGASFVTFCAARSALISLAEK